MHLKYLWWITTSVPLLPFLFFQGKKIRETVPQLPEAKGTDGRVEVGASKTLKLLMIGESTIAGVGAKTHEEAFTGTLANILSHKTKMNVDWRVYARSGYTAKRVAHKIIPKIDFEDPDLIVVGLGGNDSFKLNSPKKWKTDIKRLIDFLIEKYPSAIIAFTNMPPIKDFPAFTSSIKYVIGNLTELFRNELKELVERYERVCFNDELITFKNWSKRYGYDDDISNFFSDGVHPSVLTYQIWAKDFAKFLFEKTPIGQFK